MEIDGLNENSSSEFLALHRISLTINFTSFLTQCTMEYGVAEMPSVRALHTQKKDSEPTELERRTVKHAMQLNRFFFCVRLFVAN